MLGAAGRRYTNSVETSAMQCGSLWLEAFAKVC